MTLSDFGLGVLASWLANRLEHVSGDNEFSDEFGSDPRLIEVPDVNPSVERKRLFYSFDVFTQLHEILEEVLSPVAYLLIETEPSTHYHLVSLVLESSVTNEWYYFRRGRIAFQGTGGGHYQAERAVSIFKEGDIPISVWVLEKTLMDEFESGYVLWPEVRDKAVPFLAANIESEKWTWIKAQATQVLQDPAIF